MPSIFIFRFTEREEMCESAGTAGLKRKNKKIPYHLGFQLIGWFTMVKMSIIDVEKRSLKKAKIKVNN